MDCIDWKSIKKPNTNYDYVFSMNFIFDGVLLIMLIIKQSVVYLFYAFSLL